MNRFVNYYENDKSILFSVNTKYYELYHYNIKHSCQKESSIDKNVLAVYKPLLFPKSIFLKDTMILIEKGHKYNLTHDHCENYEFVFVSVNKSKQEKIECTIEHINTTKYLYIHGGIIEYNTINQVFRWSYPLHFPRPFDGERLNLETTWITGNLILTKMKKYDYNPDVIRIQLFDIQKMKYEYILEEHTISSIKCLCDENIVVLEISYSPIELYVNTKNGKIIERHCHGKFLEWICPGVILEYNGSDIIELRTIDPTDKKTEDKKIENDHEEKIKHQSECMICMENINNSYVLIPCGHGTFDLKCVTNLTICPVCRKPINNIQQIFIN